MGFGAEGHIRERSPRPEVQSCRASCTELARQAFRLRFRFHCVCSDSSAPTQPSKSAGSFPEPLGHPLWSREGDLLARGQRAACDWPEAGACTPDFSGRELVL